MAFYLFSYFYGIQAGQAYSMSFLFLSKKLKAGCSGVQIYGFLAVRLADKNSIFLALYNLIHRIVSFLSLVSWRGHTCCFDRIQKFLVKIIF